MNERIRPEGPEDEAEKIEIENEHAVKDAIVGILALLPEDIQRELSAGEFSVNDKEFLGAVVQHVVELKETQPSVFQRIGGNLRAVQKQLRALVREQHPELANQDTIRKTPRVGRNKPCPCGSGRKFKQCCIRKNT